MSVVEQTLEYEGAVGALLHLNSELLHVTVFDRAHADERPIFSGRAVLLGVDTRARDDDSGAEIVVLDLHPSQAIRMWPAIFRGALLIERRYNSLAERVLRLELGELIVRLEATATA